MKSKIICPCGSSVNHNYFRIHIEFISTNNENIKDYAESYNEELFNEKMNNLDDNKLIIKECDYINECNILLKNYKENLSQNFKKIIDYIIKLLAKLLIKKFNNSISTF